MNKWMNEATVWKMCRAVCIRKTNSGIFFLLFAAKAAWMWGTAPHLIHDFLSPPHSWTKTKARSVQPFLARDVIYTSRAYAMMPVSVCVSVRLSVTEVHWRIITNLGFKFRSHFTAHCGRRAAGGHRAARRAACGRIISRHASQC